MKSAIVPFCMFKGDIASLAEQEKLLGLPLAVLIHKNLKMVILDGGYPTEENSHDQKLMVLAALKHGKVINSLLSHKSLIPFRFNTSFDSKKAAVQWMAAHCQAITEELEFLEKKFEMRIWLRGAVDAFDTKTRQQALPNTPGAAYLQKKIEKLDREKSISDSAEVLAKKIKGLVGESTYNYTAKTELKEGGGFDIKIDFLLKDIEAQDFKKKVREVLKSFRFEKADITGPWPVFHFLSERFLKSLQ